MDKAQGIIRKVGSEWCIFSKKSGKRLSCHPSRKAALKRLRQIEFFKRQKGSIGAVIAFLAENGTDFEPNDFQDLSIGAMVKQSIIVKKGKGCASSRAEATRRAKQHGSIRTIRETSSSYRFRQRKPEDFDQSTFRTINVSKCVSYVVGKLKK